MKSINLGLDASIRIHIRVMFHDRRLQNTEAEQILQWTKQRPAERFVEIDVPLSENINSVTQSPKGMSRLNYIILPIFSYTFFSAGYYDRST